MIFFQGLVGAIFEGVGVSTGSLIGGYLMAAYGGSLTFRYFSFAFVIFLCIHASIQALLNKIFGPFGKRSAQPAIIANTPDEDLNDKHFDEKL